MTPLNQAERKQAERALRESEEKLRAQYKGIPVPTYTWQRVGEDFVLVDYNDAAEVITRGNVADFVGRTATEMYRDRPDIREELSRCYTEKTSIKREMEYRFETTGESKHLAVNYVFVPADLVMVHTEDITDRKRAEEAVRESEEKYRHIAENPIDGVAMAQEGRIVYVNDAYCRIFGYEKEELIGKSLLVVVAPEDRPLIEERAQKRFEGKEVPNHYVFRGMKQDGTRLWIEVSSSEAFVYKNKPTILAILRDITERRRAERALERRATQLATVGEVGRQIASILELDELLRQIVNLLEDALGYRYAYIFLLDEGSKELVLRAGAGPTGKVLEGTRIGVEARSINAYVARAGKFLLANDVAQEPMYLLVEEAPDTKSELAVPIKVKDEVIGTLDVQSTEINTFDESDLFTLQTLANQAATAIENARLYQETQRRLQELEMLHQVSAGIVSTLELEKTLQLIMDSAVKAIPSAQKGSLHLLDQERDELVMRAGSGFSREVMEAATFKVGEGYAGWAFAHNQPVIIDNVNTDPRFKPIDLLEVLEEKSAICVPLVVKGKTIGTITLDNITSYGAFDQNHLHLLSAFAHQAAIAIENARLYGETKHLAATDPLTRLWNRRHIEERLRGEIARASRFHHPLSVLVMDIDNLKLFNDTYGHPAGDEVIRTVADTLLTSCREIDIVGRYGGDEFAVLLPEADPQGSAVVAERILGSLEKVPFQAPGGTKVPINISIGAASYPSDGEEGDRLFSLADTSMYRAKVAGGGQFASLTAGPEEMPEELAVAFDVLQGLLITVDAKDRYTFEHSQEVTKRSLALARAVGLSEEEMRALEVAGKLHDVGKIGIPASILRKPGPLTGEEWTVVQEHPRLGYLILQQIPQMETVLQAVLHHHERYDGNGYPSGLTGEDIPLLSRILATADAFSAMMTDRPYRKAFTLEEALDELRRCAGKQFDPELAEKFIELVEKGEIE